MLDLSTGLKYYKREDIQRAIIACAGDREISVKYGEKGFGKRPDMLKYPSDVIEFAKKGVTSFHCSEERWNRILDLHTEMKREELDQNRKAWDLVLDIDCPFWELSKIITYLFIEALRDHGIKTISAKFSGNKGFHIGVPFEVFPETWKGKSLSSLFPEAPRAIALYLLEEISKEYIQVKDQQIIFGKRHPKGYTIHELVSVTGFPIEKLTLKKCSACNAVLKEEKKKESFDFICAKCGREERGEDATEAYRTCSSCKSIMERKTREISGKCVCGSSSFYPIFNPKTIIEVDTILLASRHMFRMPYSLHEKTGLASIPIKPEEVLSFEKKRAEPLALKIDATLFLAYDEEKIFKKEGTLLLENAMSFVETEKQKNMLKEDTLKQFQSEKKEFDKPEQALPEELFPPCIKLLLLGIKDGKKRAVFILINFLRNAGWEYDQIEELLKAWNEKNTEKLREVVWKGQLRYHKAQHKDILPPNCDAKQYYAEIGVCQPDTLCSKIKNPVSYAQRKALFLRMQEMKNKRGKKKELKTN